MGTERAGYDLEERLVDFAVATIDATEMFPGTRAGNHIAGQLMRSGTAPASNYAEAQGAESKRDFIHKLRVVFKELRESRVWLRIAFRKKLVADLEPLGCLLAECDELVRIIAASLTTAKSNLQKPGRRGH